jgi:hypothetical protein
MFLYHLLIISSKTVVTIVTSLKTLIKKISFQLIIFLGETENANSLIIQVIYSLFSTCFVNNKRTKYNKNIIEE